MKSWQRFDDECINCGESSVWVWTDSDEDNYVYEDDEAVCSKCGKEGTVGIDHDSAFILWSDREPDKFTNTNRSRNVNK